MTIAQLKRYMDRRYATRADLRREIRGIRREVGGLHGEMSGLHGEIRDLREYVQQSAIETRRHFDIVAESLRDDIRILAEAVAGHAGRLNGHETRITRLERRI